jgi:hypothetical protein
VENSLPAPPAAGRRGDPRFARSSTIWSPEDSEWSIYLSRSMNFVGSEPRFFRKGRMELDLWLSHLPRRLILSVVKGEQPLTKKPTQNESMLRTKEHLRQLRDVQTMFHVKHVSRIRDHSRRRFMAKHLQLILLRVQEISGDLAEGRFT